LSLYGEHDKRPTTKEDPVWIEDGTMEALDEGVF